MMNRKAHYLYFCILILIMISVTGACRKKYDEVAVTEVEIIEPETVVETTTEVEIENETEPETEAETEPEERIEVDGMIRSYLTGEMMPVSQADRRPIAIMMSNDKAASPQYGINRAGVVYEAPVEGGMNRYMAVIEDYDDLTRIGSVRSCRTYYTYFAREFDAIYAHYGQSTFAKPYLHNVDNINGLDGIGTVAYYRSKDKKAPHNAYSSGERLTKAIEQLGYSQEYSEDYEGHFKFAPKDKQVELSDGIDAYKVYPGYVMNNPWFTYNESDGLYYRFQYGSEHMGDEGQIVVKNIIFQYCPSGFYATTDYLNINVHEDTYGYYITNGKAIAVSCKKDGEFGVTHYYDNNGEEIVLNRGKTWICIISSKEFENTEIYGKE